MWVKQNNIYAKGKNEDKSMTPYTSQNFRYVWNSSSPNPGDAVWVYFLNQNFDLKETFLKSLDPNHRKSLWTRRKKSI